MTLPSLMVITDIARYGGSRTLGRLEQLLGAAEPGRVAVQLRDRTLPARERLAVGRELRAATRRHQQLFAVNDRVDLALMLEADGLHLGEGSVSAEPVRAWLGDRLWITRACHDPAMVGADPSVDGWVLSPVFAPRKGNPALGPDCLATARAALVARRAPAALYALGGVDVEAVHRCRAEGVGVAVIGAAFEPGDPGALLLALGIARSG